MATATFGDLMTGETRGRDPDDLRARRRAFIRAHHPDVGGDPDDFARGLAEFDRHPRSDASIDPASDDAAPDNRMRVYRSRRPDRVVRGAVRDLRRRMNGTPPRRLS